MVLTTTPRLGITGWNDRALDGPTMAQFDQNWLLIDEQVAMASSGPLSIRPLPGPGNSLFLASDIGAVFYDNGSSWICIGSVVAGTQAVVAAAGQTANLQEYRDATNNVLAKVDTSGTFTGHFTDTNTWTSPTALATGWSNAAGYYNGPQFLKSGDWVQFRGQVLAGGTATSLLAVLPAAVCPRDTQKFPVQDVTAGAYGAVAARLIGNQDAGGNQAGALYLDNFVVGRTYDLNLPYIVHA